ncbi:MAG: hypothetical protein QQN55_03695 [Nitrosopumilus sp.]
MIVDLQVYIHIRTGKEVRISPILPQQMFQFKSAWHIAARWLSENKVNIIPV